MLQGRARSNTVRNNRKHAYPISRAGTMAESVDWQLDVDGAAVHVFRVVY